jgi:hypothetical protein
MSYGLCNELNIKVDFLGLLNAVEWVFVALTDENLIYTLCEGYPISARNDKSSTSARSGHYHFKWQERTLAYPKTYGFVLFIGESAIRTW